MLNAHKWVISSFIFQNEYFHKAKNNQCLYKKRKWTNAPYVRIICGWWQIFIKTSSTIGETQLSCLVNWKCGFEFTIVLSTSTSRNESKIVMTRSTLLQQYYSLVIVHLTTDILLALHQHSRSNYTPILELNCMPHLKPRMYIKLRYWLFAFCHEIIFENLPWNQVTCRCDDTLHVDSQAIGWHSFWKRQEARKCWWLGLVCNIGNQ